MYEIWGTGSTYVLKYLDVLQTSVGGYLNLFSLGNGFYNNIIAHAPPGNTWLLNR